MSNDGVLLVQVPNGSFHPDGGLKEGSTAYFVTLEFPPSYAKGHDAILKSNKSESLQWNMSEEQATTGKVTEASSFKLTLHKAGLIGSDKVGTANIGLDALATGGAIESKDYDVVTKGGKICAQVTLVVRWKDGNMPAYAIEAAASAAASGVAPGAGGGGHVAVTGLPASAAKVTLPPCENQDFTVRLKIFKGKSLQSLDDDKLYNPRCIVSVRDKSRKTETVKKTLDPVFDEEITIDCPKVKSTFWNEIITLKVVHERTVGPHDTIGSAQIDCGSVYRSASDHRLKKKWFVLFRSATEGNVMGYLKATIAVLNLRTDGALIDDDDDDDDEEENDDDMTANLISGPGAAFEEIFLHANLIRAEGVPKMDAGLHGKCDPYVKLISGKKQVQTSHISNTYEPKWNARVQLPLLLPSLASTLTAQLWDYDATSPDDLIATAGIEISDLMDNCGPDGLPVLPPRFLNFYGPPRSQDADFNRYFKAMAKGEKKGVDFRGRLLMQLQGSRSKDSLTFPAANETTLDVSIHVEVLQLSMVPSSGKYKIKVMNGTSFGHTSVKEATKMNGFTSTFGTKNYASYFGEVVTIRTKVQVVLPEAKHAIATGSGDVAADEDALSESSLSSSATLTSEAAFDPIAACEKAAWEQIPNLVVHLVEEGVLKSGLSVLNTTTDEDPIAATVLPTEKIYKNGGTLYLSKPMRLMQDETIAKEGSKTSNPLLQVQASMQIHGVNPPCERLPVDRSMPRSIITDGPLQPFVLEAYIYRAKRLPPGDDNGLSDPFIRVCWADGTARTGTQLETISPVFNEALYVEAKSKKKYPDVVVEAWDWDLVGSDTFLCKTVVPFEEVVDLSATGATAKPSFRDKSPKWFDHWTNSTGTRVEGAAVLMSFRLYAASEAKRLPPVRIPQQVGKSKSKNKAYKAHPIPTRSLLTMCQYKISINLLGLRNTRRFRLREVQNPSIDFVIDGYIASVPKARGVNPNFDTEMEWVVTLPENIEFMPELEVRLYDHRMGTKQLVGSTLLDTTGPMVNRRLKAGILEEHDADVGKRAQAVVEYLKSEEGLEEERQQAEADREFAKEEAEREHDQRLKEQLAANETLPIAAFDSNGDGGAAASDASPDSSMKHDPAADTARDDQPLLGRGSADTTELNTVNGDVPPQERPSNGRTAVDVDAPAAGLAGLPDEAVAGMDDAIDAVVRRAAAVDDDDGASTKTDVSTEPDELLWFDRFDADPSGEGGDDAVCVAPEQRVARLGRLSKKVKLLGTGKTTAEDLYGPFDDEMQNVELYRGWGKKRTKSGRMLCDINVERLRPLTLPGQVTEAYAALRKGTTTLSHRKSTARTPTPFLARVYVIGCTSLAAKDSGPGGSSSDPYVVLRLTNGTSKKHDVVVNCKDQVRYQVLNPDFFFSRELKGTLPLHSLLRVTVYDWDRVGFDEEIGSTDINLEERYYSRRGYGKISEMIEATKAGPQDPRNYFNLRNPGCYTERRILRNDTGEFQGSIELWVDLFDAKQTVPRPLDIAPPPPIPLELRAVVWNTRDVELTDTSMNGEKMTDIYVKAYMDGMNYNTQQTDVHYRSLDGSGNFNWRMIFGFVFEPRTKRIFKDESRSAGAGADKAAKESGGAKSTAGGFKLFSVRKEAKRLQPQLHVQIYDNDLFPGTDDFIGEGLLNLTQLRPTLTRRDHQSLSSTAVEKVKSCCSCWPISKVCDRCCPDPGEVNYTLAERQEIAREEIRAEARAARERVQEVVDDKMEVLRASNQFGPAQLARLERRIRREARKANKVNVFQQFMPKRMKRSQRLREDQEADKKRKAADAAAAAGAVDDKETVRQSAAEQQAAAGGTTSDGLPVIAETGKYWFACRGPNGGMRVGDVQLSFQLVQTVEIDKEGGEKLLAGVGRSEPQALPEPDRPDSSFFWLSNPWKSAVLILWKNYRKYICCLICLLLIVLGLYLWFKEGMNVQARQFFEDDL